MPERVLRSTVWIYEVVRMGQEYGVAVPVYEKVAEKLGGIK